MTDARSSSVPLCCSQREQSRETQDVRLDGVHSELDAAGDTFLNSPDNVSGMTTTDRDTDQTDVLNGAGDATTVGGDGTTTM